MPDSTRLSTTPGPALSILVVDDDASVRTTTSNLLGDAGHSVTEAADGDEALALLRKDAFDVLLCEVRLPKVDGMTLFRLTRRISPNTAVIVVTSYAEVKDALECLGHGAPTTSPSPSTARGSCDASIESARASR